VQFQAISRLLLGEPLRRVCLLIGEDYVYVLRVRRQTAAVAGGVRRLGIPPDFGFDLARVHNSPHGFVLLPMYLLMASRKK
jgi:hypothetical protein